MKRDMDLARDILLAVEKFDDDRLPPIQVDIPDRSREEVAYHVMLLADAGLIEAMDLSSNSRLDWRARHLTWQGHEFLSTARDNTVWRKAKTWVIRQTGDICVEHLKAALLSLGRQSLGME